MKKLSLKKIVTLLLVCILMVSVCLGLGIKQIKAEETQETLATLFSETNTYNTAANSIDLQDVSNTL